jgi:hypothetical protein
LELALTMGAGALATTGKAGAQGETPRIAFTFDDFNHVLRYPGEDGAYEGPKMDALGL